MSGKLTRGRGPPNRMIAGTRSDSLHWSAFLKQESSGRQKAV